MRDEAAGVARPDAMPPAIGHHESLVLIKLASWVQAAIDSALSAEDLKYRHYATLSVLRDKGTWAQHAVAEKLRIDKATMVAVAGELERRELLGRERDPADKRHYRMWVTPAGLAWLTKAERRITAAEDEIFGPLSAAQRRTLLDLMDRLFHHPS